MAEQPTEALCVEVGVLGVGGLEHVVDLVVRHGPVQDVEGPQPPTLRAQTLLLLGLCRRRLLFGQQLE